MRCVLQGYGFLSENATFVGICEDHGIEFIGPTAYHIRTMGDKSTARDTMKVQPSALALLSPGLTAHDTLSPPLATQSETETIVLIG